MCDKNIVLIGMPASGKSAAGVVAAKIAGMDFIDSDLVIQKAKGALLPDLIEKLGPEGFIELENEVNLGIEARHSVISTGGSAIYGEEAMERFKRIGVVVYLRVRYDTLLERLKGGMVSRGVVMRRQGETLRELLEERKPLYQKYADLAIDCDRLDIQRTAESIVERTKGML